jgi:hypothetical protein
MRLRIKSGEKTATREDSRIVEGGEGRRGV